MKAVGWQRAWSIQKIPLQFVQTTERSVMQKIPAMVAQRAWMRSMRNAFLWEQQGQPVLCDLASDGVPVALYLARKPA
jgi:hypothetical protein